MARFARDLRAGRSRQFIRAETLGLAAVMSSVISPYESSVDLPDVLRRVMVPGRQR